MPADLTSLDGDSEWSLARYVAHFLRPEGEEQAPRKEIRGWRATGVRCSVAHVRLGMDQP